MARRARSRRPALLPAREVVEVAARHGFGDAAGNRSLIQPQVLDEVRLRGVASPARSGSACARIVRTASTVSRTDGGTVVSTSAEIRSARGPARRLVGDGRDDAAVPRHARASPDAGEHALLTSASKVEKSRRSRVATGGIPFGEDAPRTGSRPPSSRSPATSAARASASGPGRVCGRSRARGTRLSSVSRESETGIDSSRVSFSGCSPPWLSRSGARSVLHARSGRDRCAVRPFHHGLVAEQFSESNVRTR